MSPRARANLVRIALAALVVVAVLGYMKYRSREKSARAPVASATESKTKAGAGSGSERVVAVQIAAAENVDLPIWLEGLGTVQAFQQVTVRPQVAGRLDKVLFTEGQTVAQGDLLAQIDPRPFRVQLLQAQGALARDRAQLDAMRKQYDRYKSLHEQKLIAQQQVDELAGQLGALEGAVRIDQAGVESANLQLDYAQVKAPLAGITGVRLVDAGNLVQANDTTGIVTITAIDPVAVLYTVPQDKLPAIAAAMAGKAEVPVEVFNRDGSAKLATGKVAVLDNQVNASTSTLRLKAHVPNPTRVLWPNAFVKVRMLVETRKDALVIPAVAIQRGPQGSFVYIIGADKTAAMKPITVDLITGERAVISKGIAAGEQVVTEGANQLRPGGRVEVVKPAKEPAGPTASNKP